MTINIESNLAIFSDRLKELMNGKSILAFSKEIGIPEKTLNSWVNKKYIPKVDGLIFLAQKFNCSIDYLVGLSEH